MPSNKTIIDFITSFWRNGHEYKLSRAIRASEKRMAYVTKKIAYTDQIEGRGNN